MPRRTPPELIRPDLQALLDRLGETGDAAPSREEQIAILQVIRASTEPPFDLDAWLLDVLDRLRAGLDDARELQQRLRDILEQMSATPWQPAIYLGPVASESGPTAAVSSGTTTRVVGLGPGVTIEDLQRGDEVLLSKDLNVVMRKSPTPTLRACETAEVTRVLADGRLLVTSHGAEEVVVSAAAALDLRTLVPGDRVRFDRAVAMAFEKIERGTRSDLFLEDSPSEGFEHVGGLDDQIRVIQRAIRLHLLHPEVARRYRVRRAGSILLVGPPGTGKTMIARGLAHWIGTQTPGGRARFMNIKPAQLHSMWYSQSEANYREAFRIARAAGDAHPDIPIVMFWDEVDAIGASRGDGPTRVDDRVLTSFMTELDGLAARGNILVVAATNRRDALDPALLRAGRLGDCVIDIPRPNLAAAASILRKHLPADIPYAGDGDDEAARREVLIAAATSWLYAPNAGGDVAALTFRDGTRRAIQARELVSGALLANVARVALERACVREVEGGLPGVGASDLVDASLDQIESAVRTLTPRNCAGFVSGLPQDLAVVRVEPVVRKVRRPHRYITAA